MRVLDALSEQPSLSDRDFVGADGQLFSVFPLQAVAMAMGEGAGDRSERRSLWKVAARVPWPALLACCLYLPGIVLWAVYSLHCKANTFLFLTTVAPVAQETVDAVTNTVNTTLFTLAAGGTFIFALLLVLAIARSIQRAGVAPNNCCPCARTTPSSYYLYRVFNMGFNIIVFFVNLAIMFLMMGAFLWLVVAYAANLSIKGGVRAAADAGIDPVQQVLQANRTYSTVVSDYEKQLQQTPDCVLNSTWLKDLNGSISKILEPIPFITNKTLNGTNGTAVVNTLLCPQTCLNLGSFATLFKLQQNCICSSEQLAALQQYSGTVSADAGVCLASVILIYLACSTLHAYLIGQYVHAGYDYRAAKQRYAELIKQRRRQHALSLGGSSSNSRRHPNGGGSVVPVIPAGPMQGGPGFTSRVSGAAGGYTSTDDVELGLGNASKAFEPHHSSSSESGKAVSAAAAPAAATSDAGEIHVSAVTAGAGADMYSNLARYSRHSSGSSAAAAGWHGAGHGAKPSPLSRSSPIATSGGLGNEALAAGTAGSLAVTASLRAWDQGQLQRHRPGAVTSHGAAPGHHHQQSLHRGSFDAGSAMHTSAGPAGHSHTGSRSSAGSIREILLGAVPLDHTGHQQQQQQQQQSHRQHQQVTGSVAAAAAAAAGPVSANSSPDSAVGHNSGDSGSSGAVVPQHSINHKPSSSGGSYDSMIYHSPPNSDAGSIINPDVAAARALLDLTPQGIAKMQKQRPQHLVHSASSPSSWRGQVADPIQESLHELSSVPDRAVSLFTASEEPSPAAVQAVASSPSPSSGTEPHIYDTPGSKGSSAGDTTSSMSSSGRKARHSHRRLPAFDLSDSAHQFLTVEGLEQQQKLKRDLSSRPGSPEGAAAAAAAAALAEAAESAAAAAPGTADTSAAAAAAALTGAAEQPLTMPLQVANDWPDTAAAASGGLRSLTAPETAGSAASAAMIHSADAASNQQQRAPLSVRRHITVPTHLELPTRDGSPVMTGQQQQQVQQPAAQVQQRLQQHRTPFVSPLLPPPEQQQLLLQRQQQQLALLLEQEEQQWQQPLGSRHQRHWSTPTAEAVAAVTARSNASSPAPTMYGYQHQTASAAVDPAGAFGGRGFGLGPSGSPQPVGFNYPQRPASTGPHDYYSNSRGLGFNEPTSIYNSPMPSPLSATPATTPAAAGRYGGFMPGHAGSSSSDAAGPSIPFALGPGSVSTTSSLSASQSAGAASSMVSSFNGGLTPIGVSTASTPRSVPGSNSSMGSPAAGGLVFSNAGVSGFPGLPPTIPEVGNSGYGVDGSLGSPGQQQQQQQGRPANGGADIGSGSPLERKRSGYRSSMRKGLMAYDQYKYRQRYQQEVSSPLDPRTELSRRYRNRVPAI